MIFSGSKIYIDDEHMRLSREMQGELQRLGHAIQQEFTKEKTWRYVEAYRKAYQRCAEYYQGHKADISCFKTVEE